jgi:hypothetical protein
MKRMLAVMMIIETDDARLFPENSNVNSVSRTRGLRNAVLEHLPRAVKRVVTVMDEEVAVLIKTATRRRR